MNNRRRNEYVEAEEPARELLVRLGYRYVPRAELAAERDNERAVLLRGRLRQALVRLNPWLSEAEAERAIFKLEHVDAIGIARNRAVHEYLTYGLPLEIDERGARQTRTVRFFDFEHPDPRDGQNEYLVTTQLRVRRGHERDGGQEDDERLVIPDLVLFVNGVPLVVIEAKSGLIGDLWRARAVRQLLRYQEAGPAWQGRGAPELFDYNLLCVAICGARAAYGAVGASENAYAEWKTLAPLTDAEARERFGVALEGQGRLIIGLLSPAVLLDILRDFVVYEPEKGRLMKKLPRYQQYRAVTATMQRILHPQGRRPLDAAGSAGILPARGTFERAGETPALPGWDSLPGLEEKRGGVIWHTQGSGKSLTMLWLATKLRREPRLRNPLIALVTDRRQLDEQITATFTRSGFFAPEHAGSTRALHELLSSSGGRTVSTTIQKFEEALAAPAGRLDLLNAADNIFVMVDEAHRTQYGRLAALMRAALPSAVFIGFTGTPIDRGFARSTMATFGPLIDSYTIPQAVADGATVPILYEARLPELSLQGADAVDRLFTRMFGDEPEETQARIRRRYANTETLAEAEQRIEQIAEDIATHFEQSVRPNGFKAQVVAPSRAAALRYAGYLQAFKVDAYPIITTSADDGSEFRAARELDKDDVIARFVDPQGSVEVLVVVDMLLTGFDAPVEQVLYLDRGLREHALLQGIARVNRRCTLVRGGVTTEKSHGLVIDYWGVSRDLAAALSEFQEQDRADAWQPLPADPAAGIEAAARSAEGFFSGLDLNDTWACVHRFDAERATDGEYKADLFEQFSEAYRHLSTLLDQFLPDPAALPYLDRLARLTTIRAYARATFLSEDTTLDWQGISAKLKAVIDGRMSAELRRLMQPISILDPDLMEKIASLPHAEARASVLEHALRAEISERLAENPAFYERLSARLQAIIDQMREHVIDAAAAVRELWTLQQEALGIADRAAQHGLSPVSFAVYELLERTAAEPEPERALREEQAVYRAGLDDTLKAVSIRIEQVMAAGQGVVAWDENEDVLRLMRRDIKRELRRSLAASEEQMTELTLNIVEIARRTAVR